jgi:hypothetical protein
MSPQQVPNLVVEAINLAKTMPASFKTAEVAGKADTPSFPRLNAPYNVRLGLTMKAPQVTRNQGPTAHSRSQSQSI